MKRSPNSRPDAGFPEARVVGELIPVLRYSTSDLPAPERYRAWYLRAWPRAAPVYRTEPTEPFNTSWETAQLGLVTFVHTQITGMRWERRIQDIRTSDFDPIILSMMVNGFAQGDMDGRPFREFTGSFHFHDLARPSLHVSTASVTYNLVFPRAVAVEWFGSLQDLHGLVVDGDAAAMLLSHAGHVHRMLPRLETEQADRLGRVFLELAASALTAARPAPSARLSVEEGLRRRAAEEIDRRLGDGEVSIVDLCRALGVSRARLFAAFKSDNGVLTYVRLERLKRARAALADLDRSESMGAIAHRLGFADASRLSHAFRRHYGMSPREYRALVASDATAPTPD